MSLIEEATKLLGGVGDLAKNAGSSIGELFKKMGELVMFVGAHTLGHVVKKVGVFTYHAINHVMDFNPYNFDFIFKGFDYIREAVNYISSFEYMNWFVYLASELFFFA